MYHVVTDSAARFSDERLLQDYPVTVVPYHLVIGGQTYRDEVDLTPEEALHLAANTPSGVRLLPPSVAEYAAVFAQLSDECKGIIAVTTSREMTRSWQHARQAAQQMGESVPIAVVDSRTICAGQGILVRLAAQMAMQKHAFEDWVRQTRGAVERIFAVYYTDDLKPLQRNDIMSDSRAILGTFLGIKPFLSIEEGELIVIEKVQTRLQALERLVEFVVEFEQLEDVLIVQYSPNSTEQTRSLQNRLAETFPERHFPHAMYGTAMATFLGADAMGVAVLESEMHNGF